MKPTVRNFLAGLSFFLAILVVDAAPRPLLDQRIPDAVATASVIGKLPADRQLDLVISLPLRNRAALTNLLEQISDPASPNYRHYLTPAQFTEQFGPAEADYQTVIAFAQSNGLRVTHTHANRTLVDVRGPVAAINKAFHLTLTEYQHPTEQRTFFAPNVPPTLDLPTPVLSVAGLDNFAVPRPLLKPQPLRTNQAKPQSLNGSGPGGNYIGQDFRTAYAPGVTWNGAGEKVGLLEFDGYYPQDIPAYEDQAGLSHVPVTNVLLNTPGLPATLNGTEEVSLDIDLVIAMAPGLSEVIVYEGIDGRDILNQMANDDTARQLSSSWTFATDAAIIQIFQQLNAQGQSFFQAAGDSDAYPGATAPPTDVPYLTCVGGTTLSMTSGAGAYASETVWNWGGGEGTGGGVSASFSIPSWQQGIDMTLNQGSTTHRNIPDVAAVADQVFSVGDNGKQLAFGGTSCAAPLWAAYVALANQLAASNGLPAVGFINPAIYAFGKGSTYGARFHDTTVGNNEGPLTPTKFIAVPGYDLCTGWGTPNGSNLLYALGLPETMQVTPVQPEPFAGPLGGPFGPATLTFTIANSGTNALDWAAGTTSSLFDFAPAGGVVPALSSIPITVTPRANVANLDLGIYLATFSFTNLNDHYVQSRTVSLLVASVPIITAPPTNQILLEGQSAFFHVAAATNAQLAYQWWRDNGVLPVPLVDSNNVSGSTTATLSLADVTLGDAGSYFVVVSNAAGIATSSNATLTLTPSGPVMAQLPASLTLLPGENAQFSALAVGTQPIAYQWKFNGTNLSNNSTISGANSNTLTIANISPTWAGSFTVVASNALGTNSATATLSVNSITAPGVTLSTLYSFPGNNSGETPFGGLTTNHGLPTLLYGTTLAGGASGYGNVFKMAPGGTPSVVVSFSSANGANPYAGLTLGSDNFLYGVTSTGGTGGGGTIFRVSNNGFLTTLASLSGENGNEPVASLFQAHDGAFYGTTVLGGIFGQGNLFRITTGGSLSTIVSFDGLNGSEPTGSLVEDASHNLYGTTEAGGAYGAGTIFQITPSGQLRTWITFDGYTGAEPSSGLTFDAQGNLYGTAYAGGFYGEGEIFKLSPDGSGVVLYDFTGGTDGANPFGALLLGADGNLYGTTQAGGNYNAGTVFEISPDGALVTLAALDGFNGAQPTGTLLQYQGDLYGTAAAGGADGFGSIFKVSLSGPLQITSQPADLLVDLGGTGVLDVAAFGAGPAAYQWRRNGTNLIDGATVIGSATRVLTITNAAAASAGIYSVVISNAFGSVTSAPARVQVLISTPEITQQPSDASILAGSAVTLAVQAAGDYPLTYQWYQNGAALADNARISGSTSSVLTIQQSTASDAGTYSVIVSDDLFYEQSSNAVVTVSPLSAPGYALQIMHSFKGSDGANPNASLMQARDGNLYGTTVNGGAENGGALFSVNTNGGFATFYSFTGGSDGANIYAALTQGAGADPNLYGVAAAGGDSALGTIFRVATNQAVTALHEFTGGDDGSSPNAPLTLGNDGRLYGSGADGGVYGEGTVFAASTNGAVTPLYAFSSFTDGAIPIAGLTLGPDGKFYGSTYQGGAFGLGILFAINTNGALATLHDFSGVDGANPLASLASGSDGKLYGTTYLGGNNGFGDVFSLAANGTYTNIFSLNYADGALLNAGLTPSGDGGFFGAAQNGGPGGAGGIFKITTNGICTPIFWFTGTNGAYPEAAPVRASDGYYYGTTFFGGTHNAGTVYRFSVPAPPQITAQPADAVAYFGNNVSFSVAAASSTALAYQWYFNGAAILQATNAVYSLTNLAATNAGSYAVTLMNAGGSITSRLATLSLAAPPLIANGGFETGDFTGWTLSGNDQNFIVQSNAVSVHGGIFGAQLAATNALGYLTEIVPTTPGTAYIVSLWINIPVAPLELSVAWNGGGIADETNLTATGWTNLQWVVTATNAASAVTIGARADAGFFGVDDVTVTPLPLLEAATVSDPPGQTPEITFDWSASPGSKYQVQFKDALSAAVWTNLGPPTNAGLGPVGITDALTNAQRFYRIVFVP
ncbi:MAG TPA: choice-of-anchor tandem repeat GloVer-containing protein [Verrucomicrobiae bacterium]|nr:choice-of-anchor tandem repeat GloVer-containing protein [Verrucomicrobiae bacterium]